MKAASFEGARTLQVADHTSPVCRETDIVINVAYCGVCGSDLHSYLEGAFVKPGQVMGHEFSGIITEIGTSVTGLAVGDAVTARPLTQCGQCPRCAEGRGNLCEKALTASLGYGLPGAFADQVLIPDAVAGDNVYLLPDNVDLAAGACVEPMAVALRLAKSARPTVNDVAVVIGLGSIGLNIVQMLHALGAGTVVGIDISPARLALAEKVGADYTVNAAEQDALEAVRRITGAPQGSSGGNVDIVVEASGVPALLAQAVTMTRVGGRLRIAALYESEVQIDANQIVQKEMDVAGSFAYDREFPEVLELLREGKVDAAMLVSHTFPLDQIDEAFAAQLDKGTSLKVLVSGPAASATRPTV